MGPKSNFGVFYILLLMGPNWFYLSVAFTVPGEKNKQVKQPEVKQVVLVAV